MVLGVPSCIVVAKKSLPLTDLFEPLYTLGTAPNKDNNIVELAKRTSLLPF